MNKPMAYADILFLFLLALNKRHSVDFGLRSPILLKPLLYAKNGYYTVALAASPTDSGSNQNHRHPSKQENTMTNLMVEGHI